MHDLRARVDTIMVGVGTVLADDPQLTVRDAGGRVTGRQPLRVVLDSTGRTPQGAKVLDDAASTWLATAADAGAGPDGRVDPARVLDRLYRRGQRHVLLEGGPRLAAAMLDAGLVDEALIYLAPVLLGAGRQALEGGTVEHAGGRAPGRTAGGHRPRTGRAVAIRHRQRLTGRVAAGRNAPVLTVAGTGEAFRLADPDVAGYVVLDFDSRRPARRR